MSDVERISQLGAKLRAKRREKRMSLRDLAVEIGVSLNTLSRVERGHVPDLTNFQRIAAWLDVPVEQLLVPVRHRSFTPEIIARHLLADRQLTSEAATRIAQIVEEMYHNLASEQRTLAVHLRSAKAFTPAACTLLAEVLHEMHSTLQAETGE